MLMNAHFMQKSSSSSFCFISSSDPIDADGDIGAGGRKI
jgi:hypothetical protein